MKTPNARTALALGIPTLALLGIIGLSAVILLTDTDTSEESQLLLNSVLPLFGTWVGTVLAYYFSRENFEAASSSTERLVQLTVEDRLRATAIRDVMTRDIYAITGTERTKSVFDVYAELRDRGFERLPIFETARVLEALLYLVDLGQYIIEAPQKEPADDPKTKTLEDLLQENPALNRIGEAAFVSEKATLADAKSAMDRIAECEVVFVTTGGGRNDPVVGIVTNTDIARHSRA